MSNVKVKVFTGSGSFNVRDEMLKDSKDAIRAYAAGNLIHLLE